MPPVAVSALEKANPTVVAASSSELKLGAAFTVSSSVEEALANTASVTVSVTFATPAAAGVSVKLVKPLSRIALFGSTD